MPATASYVLLSTGWLRATVGAAVTLGACCVPSAAERAALGAYVGAPTFPISATDLEGAPLSIAPAPGRITLVHFFASWCEPCAEELPALAAFVRQRSGSVRLIGVTVSEPASRAKRFASRFNLPAAIALDQDKTIAGAFRVRGLPATVALSPDGARALAAAGPLDWTSVDLVRALDGLLTSPKTPQGETR